MKIILSRKGIDSGVFSGRMASPILPCGCLCSIPIPYKKGIPYSDIRFGQWTLQQIVTELNPSWSHRVAHLDPDLRPGALASRPNGWKPAFGQSGAAAGHLANQYVDEGDLFIFFGWFRKTKKINGKLRFDPADIHGRHIVYGWLEVRHRLDKLPLPDDLLFLKDHPHVRFSEMEARPNKIYVSSESGLKAGLFSTESEGVTLTKGNGYRSCWLLDEAFESLLLERDLSYHGKETRWGQRRDKEGTKITLKTVSRGQEFVLDGKKHSEVREYFIRRIKATLAKTRDCPHTF
jgi:Nucleotide modification associated domain 3